MHVAVNDQEQARKELSDSLSSELVALWQHAMVLAHIASKRTDDPKIGVGAVLVYADGSYGSVSIANLKAGRVRFKISLN